MKSLALKISIIMGSKSDLETVGGAVEILKHFNINYEIKILSAHRSPRELVKYVERLPQRGIKVIIAAAGGAAALAGTVAAHTILPVIGIPIETKALKGLDSLLSTVQMPKGIAVACMAIGRTGAQNAAIFACQLLALQDTLLKNKFLRYKKEMALTIKKVKIKL